jgi:hypothetical protein
MMEDNHEGGVPAAAGDDVAEIMGLMQSSIDDTRQLLEALLSLKATHGNIENMAGHVVKLGERMARMSEIERLIHASDFEALQQSVTQAAALVNSLDESLPQLLDIWRLTGKAIGLLHQTTSSQASSLLREVEFMGEKLKGEIGGGNGNVNGSV